MSDLDFWIVWQVLCTKFLSSYGSHPQRNWLWYYHKNTLISVEKNVWIKTIEERLAQNAPIVSEKEEHEKLSNLTEKGVFGLNKKWKYTKFKIKNTNWTDPLSHMWCENFGISFKKFFPHF